MTNQSETSKYEFYVYYVYCSCTLTACVADNNAACDRQVDRGISSASGSRYAQQDPNPDQTGLDLTF